MIKKFADFLERFKNLKGPKFVEKVVAEILEKEGLSVDSKSINYSKGILFIKTHPIIKNEILFQKQKILSLFLRDKRTENIKDIK